MAAFTQGLPNTATEFDRAWCEAMSRHREQIQGAIIGPPTGSTYKGIERYNGPEFWKGNESYMEAYRQLSQRQEQAHKKLCEDLAQKIFNAPFNSPMSGEVPNLTLLLLEDV